MAALTADAARLRRNIEHMRKGSISVATGAEVFQGSLLCINETTERGLAATAATGRTFLGISLSNTTGNTAGTVSVPYGWAHEELLPFEATLTAAFTGTNVLVENDNEVGNTSVGTAAVRVEVGMLTEHTSAGVWVEIRRFSNKSIP